MSRSLPADPRDDVPSRQAGALTWADPGVMATLVLGLLLTAFAVTVDFPKVATGFQSDEATYYTLAHSLVRDGDFAFERRDLARVWEEFPTGPEGIFLKRGRALDFRLSSRFPFIAWEGEADPGQGRVYFAKSYIYPLAAAPFVWIAGTNGFLLLHAVLFTVAFLAAYAFLRARSAVAPALGFAAAFFLASAAPVYFVWLTPEIFNFSLGVWALFLWCYKEVAPASASGGRWSRFVRGDASTYVGGALVGVLTFSKPPYVALVLPMVALALWRRQWRPFFVTAVACTGITAALFMLNLAITGEMNYQGGDRNTFYGGTGFPFQTPDTPFRSAMVERGRNEVLTDVLFSRDALLAVLPRNLGYFIFGRHTGLLPYFFPGVLAVVLFLAARRAPRPLFQWLTLAAATVANVGLLILVPYTYSGGGGPIGNRYFMGLYPMLLFVVPALGSMRPVWCAVGVGWLFTAQLTLNPFYVSFHPAEHPKSGPYRWLPVERTLLNDLPVNVAPNRVRQPLGGVPPMSAYFLDDNAYGREGEWFWVKGESRAELLLRGPAEPRPDGSFDSKRIKRLLVEVRSGDVWNRVAIKTDGDSKTLDLDPQSSATVALRVVGGVPYRKEPGQPTSYVYGLSIASRTGFTPLFTSGSRDSRYLGAYIRLVPVYE